MAAMWVLSVLLVRQGREWRKRRRRRRLLRGAAASGVAVLAMLLRMALARAWSVPASLHRLRRLVVRRPRETRIAPIGGATHRKRSK